MSFLRFELLQLSEEPIQFEQRDKLAATVCHDI